MSRSILAGKQQEELYAFAHSLIRSHDHGFARSLVDDAHSLEPARSRAGIRPSLIIFTRAGSRRVLKRFAKNPVLIMWRMGSKSIPGFSRKSGRRLCVFKKK